jgi:DNA-binding MarR family transcriptional regulator
MKELDGRPPTSHFHVQSAYDSLLSTLELNFFITKYYEMKDRDGKEVSVFALNNGLCQQEAITFGRPTGKREHRLYFVERFFDFTPIVVAYVRANQEIVCGGCGTKHSFELLGAIQAFDMLCPTCKSSRCVVVNLSRKYEKLIQEVSAETLLPPTELGILQTLHNEKRKMFANEIAAELDCSYQLVGKRSLNLADRDLIDRDKNDQGRRIFEIRTEAEEVYFTKSSDDKLRFDDQD